MRILGIESSCDETAAAIVETSSDNSSVKIISQSLATSLSQHAATGGIIPEVAARAQTKYIIPVLYDVLQKANLTFSATEKPDIDAIAITYGPGLIGSLLVGVETAKTLSYIWNIPLIPVNHLYGHMYANWVKTSDDFTTPKFPIIALIVSGGHTDLVLMKSHTDITWLGGTRDDAAGEAFDKIGRLLGFDYPAGPKIEQAAKNGNPKAYHFPRPLLHDKVFDFSFSGLKTAVLREVEKLQSLSEQAIQDISKGVQDAISDVLVTKTLQAAEKYNASSIIISGGVAANQTLRDKFTEKISSTSYAFYTPQKFLCTDNGVMIATAAAFHQQIVSWQQLTANPQLYFD